MRAAPARRRRRRPVLILNAFSLLAAGVAVAQLILGALTAWLALRALRSPGTPGERPPLLELTAPRLVLLGAASVPLLYLMLRSWVAEWPGVMCVQGVTRIGTFDHGAAGWLPALLGTIVVTKALLLLVGGGWIALHAVDRRTRTAPLARRVTAAIALAGCVAVADASAELAYVAIPKREARLTAGCCNAAALPAASALRTDPDDADAAARRRAWVAAFFCASGATGAVAALTLRRGLADVDRLVWAPATAAGALAASVSGAEFVCTALAPARLDLPQHACTYCLLEQAPETWVGVAAFAAATCAALWAAVVAFAARSDGVREARDAVLRPLLTVAAVGYAAALAMAFVQGWIV